MTTSTAGLPVTGVDVHRFGKDLENLREDCSRSSAVRGGGMFGGERGEAWSQFCWELDLGLDGKESQQPSRFDEDSVPLQPGQKMS